MQPWKMPPASNPNDADWSEKKCDAWLFISKSIYTPKQCIWLCLAHSRLTLRFFFHSRPPCQNRDLWACWLHHRGPDHCYRCPRTGTIQGVPLGFRRISCQVEVLLNDLQGTFCIKTTGLKGFPVQIKPDSTDQQDLDGYSYSKMIMLLAKQWPCKLHPTISDYTSDHNETMGSCVTQHGHPPRIRTFASSGCRNAHTPWIFDMKRTRRHLAAMGVG